MAVRAPSTDSLVYHCNVNASPDGLAGDEVTFSLCSFWWVEAFARDGRHEEARHAFEKVLTYANIVGLYSGEIGPTGEQLANFPPVEREAGRRGSALAGAQRRRLDLALALVGDPHLIFLDEPTTGFDPAARRTAWSGDHGHEVARKNDRSDHALDGGGRGVV